jgi:hypothetical protein
LTLGVQQVARTAAAGSDHDVGETAAATAAAFSRHRRVSNHNVGK